MSVGFSVPLSYTQKSSIVLLLFYIYYFHCHQITVKHILWLVSYYKKHNCVLLNAGLSNALTKTGFCTSKIRFLFPVSFIVEYKVGIAEFYMYMGSDADLLKDVLTRA